MNTTVGLLLCATALCANVAAARGITEKSSARHTMHFSGNGERTLEVRTVNGSITVQTHEGRDVEIIVDKSVTADSQAAIAAAEEVMLDLADNAATVGAIVRHPDFGVCGEQDSWKRTRGRLRYSVQYDFTVRVPRDTRLQLCTINNGDITVTGTRGDFVIRNVNGKITLTDMAGSGDAITVNGRVAASFVSAPRTDSHFKTINGDVVVTVPAAFNADLRMKSFNGGLFTDFETQPLSQPLVADERSGAMKVFRSNSFTSVRVGNGGPVLTLDTMNGDVRVLRNSQ
jgi:DUF4097 and DUF4098 domain-containing protein YvlB